MPSAPHNQQIFNRKRFAQLLKAELDRRGLSSNAAAREIGTDSANIIRISRGQAPNMEDFLRIMRWLPPQQDELGALLQRALRERLP